MDPLTGALRAELLVAFRDNRCTQHIAVNDPMPSRRVMRRLQILGDTPF